MTDPSRDYVPYSKRLREAMAIVEKIADPIAEATKRWPDWRYEQHTTKWPSGRDRTIHVRALWTRDGTPCGLQSEACTLPDNGGRPDNVIAMVDEARKVIAIQALLNAEHRRISEANGGRW